MTTRICSVLALTLALTLAAATPALAQDGNGPFFRGLAGVTFGTESAAAVGAGVGVPVSRTVHIYFEGGYISSVLPDNVLSLVEDILNDSDLPFSDLSIAAPSFYGLFGARFSPAGGGVRPFVEGLFGFARTSADFSVTIGGIEFDTSDLGLDLGLTSTEGAFALGGGVVVPMGGRASFEAGYRLFRILVEDGANTHKVYGAVRFGF